MWQQPSIRRCTSGGLASTGSLAKSCCWGRFKVLSPACTSLSGKVSAAQPVPDVEQFPGHIACSSASRSEIVVPVFNKEGNVIAVLDIDSEHLATFDDTDRRYLEQICQLIA